MPSLHSALPADPPDLGAALTQMAAHALFRLIQYIERADDAPASDAGAMRDSYARFAAQRASTIGLAISLATAARGSTGTHET